MVLVPEFSRQRQVDLAEFETTLVYRVSLGQSKLHKQTLSQKKRVESKLYT